MLKPQDIVVLLKLHLWQGQDWTYESLAKSLDMSNSEVHAALKRCEMATLYNVKSRRVHKQPLLEFIIHGLRYVFFAQPGAISRGMPTAHSAPPLNSQLTASSEETYVWSDAEGTVRGQSITPLYKSVPSAAKKDAKLYQLLSIIDALRVGRARDRTLAIKELEQRLGNYA
jgi:hypothetical protein